MNDELRGEALSLLRQFTEAPGPPGHEDSVRSLFHQLLAGRPDHRFECDRLGSIVCRRSGDPETGPNVLVTAHLDEVGFLVQSVAASGLLPFLPLGSWWPHSLLAQRVTVITRSGKRVLGVIGSTPPHLLPDEARRRVLPIEAMFIDVGARDSAQATGEFGIRPGDPVVPVASFEQLQDPDVLLAKAFDNRSGIALLTQCLQRRPPTALPYQLVGAATVQEEIGLRGARTAARLIQPSLTFVLEGPPADDTFGLSPGQVQGGLGLGVQIRVSDPSALMNRRLVDFCIDTAHEAGIPHQTAVRRNGGTDAGAFHLHDAGVPCVVLGVPARYIHSHNSIIHLADYLAALRLLEAVLDRLTPERIASFTRFLT
ncbi:MAG TPA: M20/M25/M40 family metallo-hydrolase [Verrucomicrobiales bacterium]|nr:M20/M25/M40 family metallo-hydrolase [Verrucomicrobiales bacterium]